MGKDIDAADIVGIFTDNSTAINWSEQYNQLVEALLRRVPEASEVDIKLAIIESGVEALFCNLQNDLAVETYDAATDDLTGAYERKHFDAYFKSALSRASAQSSHVLTVFCDVDHFRNFNNEHGHAVGDAVLAQFADRLRAVAPDDSAYVARYGGEEFVIVFKSDSLDECRAVISAINKDVCSFTASHEGVEYTVGASFGATLNTDSAVPDTVLKRADDLLYQAKDQGRGQLVMDEKTADLLYTADHAPSVLKPV